MKASVETFKQTWADSVDNFVKSAGEDVVRTIETQKKEQQKIFAGKLFDPVVLGDSAKEIDNFERKSSYDD